MLFDSFLNSVLLRTDLRLTNNYRSLLMQNLNYDF